MVKWIISRVTDLLIALLVMTVILVGVLTQPVLNWSQANEQQLPLERSALEQELRALLAIPVTYDTSSRFEGTAQELANRLSAIGSLEQNDRSDGQKVLRLRVGNPAAKKLYVVLHYVVTEKPILEVAETTLSLIELAKAVSKEEDATALQLNLTIFLHPVDGLETSLNQVSLAHAEQLLQAKATADDPVLVFMPGLRLPEAAYISKQWRYFSLLMPGGGNNLAIFGRFNDIVLLRHFKKALFKAGLNDLSSISIPVNFPNTKPSPLKAYWDNHLAAMLLRPNILLKDKNYEGHVRFISAFYTLVKQGY
ncbi:hypothetical protein SAMN02745130_03011 [Thiothrix eikelboomii]|uniref:Uncharacterized protein n=1 Tax=Thiothrix eikelboomii TaxID=92487 RepID=A0A1T4XJ97_9GAMM|nr:hypothetical protein [Thiothrix eikelboomii]SKA89175.1 hypothetical protein SAMN02745130_03011 [Thiothrix eikelboomii]